MHNSCQTKVGNKNVNIVLTQIIILRCMLQVEDIGFEQKNLVLPRMIKRIIQHKLQKLSENGHQCHKI